MIIKEGQTIQRVHSCLSYATGGINCVPLTFFQFIFALNMGDNLNIPVKKMSSPVSKDIFYSTDSENIWIIVLSLIRLL